MYKHNQNMKLSRQELGVHLLRLGLAAVFLWFGFSQLLNSQGWVSIVPVWTFNLLHLPPAMLVLANGVFEVVLGSLLAMGFFVRIIALIFGLHLIPIALNFGFTATAIRDFGLITALFALALIYNPKSSED